MSDTGGPAFPVAYSNEADGPTVMPTEGMTLRDYFAAKALQGLLPSAQIYSDMITKTSRPTTELDVFLATMAYRYADQMLKARQP